MNIYLHPNGVKKELKNDYIGGVYEYSYDFRGKSSTILTNDGWTVGSWYTFDANWIGSSNWSPVTKAIPFSLENARKITFTCWLYNTNTGLSSVGIQNTASSNTNSCYIYTDYDRPALSEYWINGVKTSFAYTPLSWQSSRIYTIDLENLTFNIVCWTFTKNWTITQADANWIRNNKYFNIIIRYWTCRIQYINLLVE